MNPYKKTGIIMLLFVLQLSVMPLIKIKTAMPNLILVYVVLASFFEGERAGIITGFVCGLLQDLFSLSYFGLSVIALTITGFLAGINSKIVYHRDSVTLSLFTFGFSLFYGGLYAVLLFILGEEFTFQAFLLNSMLYPAIYNLIAAFIISFPFLKAYKRDERLIRKI